MHRLAPLFILLTLIGTLFLLTTPEVLAQTNYKLLAPLPGTEAFGKEIAIEGNLPKYLQNLFSLGIGVAIALSVVMIVVGGAQYLSTDAIYGKSEGKDKLWNAVWGLVLALAAYLILNTINPNILDLKVLTLTKLKQAEKSEAERGLVGGGSERVIYKDCNDCTALESTGITVKAPGAAGSTGGCLNVVKVCQVNKGLASKLESFKKELGSGITWTVSEAWPPTRNHKDPCHQDGSCMDVSVNNNQRSVTVLNRMVAAGDKVGLTLQYEVPDKTRAAQLRGAGVRVVYVEGITGEHFSVYNK